MRTTRQILADLLWPIRPSAPGQDSNAHLRPLIALVIVLYCGPEMFAAADLILLLDLLGVTLFLTAFNAGFRAMMFSALARVQEIFLPAEWAALIRSCNPASVVAHGLVLVGFNALILAVLILAMSSSAQADDRTSVSIRVKQDGQMCELLNQIAECTSLPEVLSQEFGADRNIPLSVSPEGCGEAAIGQIRVIVIKLKTAGYLQVSVAANLSKPNYKCTPAPPVGQGVTGRRNVAEPSYRPT